MNAFSKIVPLAVTISAIMMLLSSRADAVAPGPKVSEIGNRHNLSSANTAVTYRATNDPVNNPRGQQICIFCHTPHSANAVGQAPLWNRTLSTEVFQRYTSATLNIRHIANAQYNVGAQPNGSSRLCLSCHDGVSKLGAVYNGPEITMMTGYDVITGLASFNPSTNKMKSGHHPVSFVYLTGFNYGSQSGTVLAGLPAASYRFIPLSSAGKVKLYDSTKNGNGWMQCTSCHDPHQNQSEETGANSCYNAVGALGTCDATHTRKVAPFWTYHGVNTTPTQDSGSVCKVCHALTAPGTYAPWP